MRVRLYRKTIFLVPEYGISSLKIDSITCWDYIRLFISSIDVIFLFPFNTSFRIFLSYDSSKNSIQNICLNLWQKPSFAFFYFKSYFNGILRYEFPSFDKLKAYTDPTADKLNNYWAGNIVSNMQIITNASSNPPISPSKPSME